ncbi:MAG: hypothetical protein M1274_03935 [Actinobacteria bacterium]|nr:hypothetical protein [Actinomycetota bacterium]
MSELAPVSSTPYSRNPDELANLLSSLRHEATRVGIDAETYTDLGSLTIYKVSGQDACADVGRTLEAKILGSEYGYAREFIEHHFQLFDRHSLFFVACIEDEAASTRLVGTLRIIDCAQGDSETVSMFREFYGENTPLPRELNFRPEEDRVWDILSVAVERPYRNGITASWLYHALYKASLQENVKCWVANITPREAKNLICRLGIPFRTIRGVDPVHDVPPNGTVVEYGFYHLNLVDCGPAVKLRMSHLEEAIEMAVPGSATARMNKLLLRMARICWFGAGE